MSAFGSGLGGTNGPTTLTIKDSAGVSRDAQIGAGSGQVNFLVPPRTAAGPALFTVNYAGKCRWRCLLPCLLE